MTATLFRFHSIILIDICRDFTLPCIDLLHKIPMTDIEETGKMTKCKKAQDAWILLQGTVGV